MSDAKFCPLLLAGINAGALLLSKSATPGDGQIAATCHREMCAWWCVGGQICCIPLAAVGMADAVKDFVQRLYADPAPTQGQTGGQGA